MSTSRALALLLLPIAASGQEPALEQLQAIARGKTLLVAVGATKKPIADVLADLAAKTAVPIDRAAVPADAVTTLAPATVSLWDAVEQICRAHGKLTWDVSPSGITIKSEPYVAARLATSSGYGLLLRGFARFTDRGGEERTRSDAVVVGPPGAIVALHYLTFSELVDDKGTNLLKAGSGPWVLGGQSTFGSSKRLGEPDPSHPFCAAPSDFDKPAAARGATKIKSCKGVAIVRAVVQLKKTIAVAGNDLKKGGSGKAGGSAIAIESIDVNGASVRMKVALTDARRGAKDKTSFHPETPGRVVLRDSAGAEVRGVTLNPTTGSTTIGIPGPAAGDSETMHCEITAQLPPNTTLAAIELWEPGDVEELKIPFVFKDVPLTAGR